MLVSLSEKFAEIGYLKTTFKLRITRQEISNFLGMSLETVNRTLSELNEIGRIQTDQRTIHIIEHEILKTFRRLLPSKSRFKPRAPPPADT